MREGFETKKISEGNCVATLLAVQVCVVFLSQEFSLFLLLLQYLVKKC